MLHDLQSHLEVKTSIQASVDATGGGTSDGAWVDCRNIINITTVLVQAKAAAGTLTAAPITVEEADDSSGTNAQAISAAAHTAVLGTPSMRRFERSKPFCRARLGTTAGTATAAIVSAAFIGQKQTVNS